MCLIQGQNRTGTGNVSPQQASDIRRDNGLAPLPGGPAPTSKPSAAPAPAPVPAPVAPPPPPPLPPVAPPTPEALSVTAAPPAAGYTAPTKTTRTRTTKGGKTLSTNLSIPLAGAPGGNTAGGGLNIPT